MRLICLVLTGVQFFLFDLVRECAELSVFRIFCPIFVLSYINPIRREKVSDDRVKVCVVPPN